MSLRRFHPRLVLSFVLLMGLLFAMLGPAQGSSRLDDEYMLSDSSESILITPSPVTPSPTPTITPTPTPGIIEIGSSPSDETRFGTDGGLWEAESVPLDLDMPSGALTETVKIQLSIPELDAEESATYLVAFELGVSNEEGAIEPTLAQSMTLAIDLTDFLDEEDETGQRRSHRRGTPAFFWWNRFTRRWLRLNSKMNWRTGRARVRSRRLAGRFAVGFSEDVGSYGVQYTPSLKGISNDPFSGNSSISYPLRTPPGPGGFGLNLALSYSSEGANSILAGTIPKKIGDREKVRKNQRKFNTQASPIGWGWNLHGLGHIQHVPKSDTNSTADVHLNYNGGSFELIEGNDGWQSKPQAFVKIQKESDTLWYMWTKNGTRYTFGSDDWQSYSLAYNIDPNKTCSGDDDLVELRDIREIHLSEIQDVHGNRIVLNYEQDKRAVRYCPDYVRYVRPIKVKYFPANEPLDSARIVFGYSDRLDYKVEKYDNDSVQVKFTHKRLNDITMQVRSDVDSGPDPFLTTHSYELSHTYDAFDEDDEDDEAENNSGKSIMLLDSVVEKSHEGNPLQPWTFGYERQGEEKDNANLNMLTEVDNGQGGNIKFDYKVEKIKIRHCSAENWSSNTERYHVSEKTLFNGIDLTIRNRFTVIPPSQRINNSAFVQGWGWWLGCFKDFEFGGYNYVRHDLYEERNGVETHIQRNLSRFHQKANGFIEDRKGKLWQSQLWSPDGVLMQQADITWKRQDVLGSPWVYKSAETMMLEGAKKKTEYHYVPAHQGGTQYGNLTHVKEYLDEGNTLYRTKETVYVPNDQDGAPDEVTYIVSAPVRQLLWDAEVGQSCEADTALFYDESELYGEPPTKGLLTMVQVADEACDGSRIITKSRYDAWGNPIEQINALGNSTTTVYDTSENTSDWPRLYTYPMNVTVPLLGTTHYSWNKVIGQVSSVKDVNDVITNYTYDEWGRLHKEWAKGNGGASTTIIKHHDYDEASNTPYHMTTAQRTTIGDEVGDDIYHYIGGHTYYDGLGQEIQTRSTYINPQNQHKHAVTRTDYNAFGSPSVVYAPVEDDGDRIYRGPDWPGWQNQAKSVSEYDTLGRVTKATAADGTFVEHHYGTYASSGTYFAWHDVIDQNRHRKHQQMDVLGRTVRVLEMAGDCGNYWADYQCDATFNEEWLHETTTRYEYDVKDQLVKLTDDADNETTMSYDLAGRKTGMNDPDMGVWAYKYDILGNLTRQTDARGTRLCFFYDELNRVTGKQYRNDDNCSQGAGLDVSYFYDEGQYGKGQRTRMEDASGSTSWQYDEKGRAVSESKIISHNGTPLTFTTSWSYDAADRIHTMTYPADEEGNLGEQITYQYSQDEHKTRASVTGLVSDLGTYVSGMEYNVYGQLTSATLGTSQPVTQQFTYYALDDLHGLGRLREIESLRHAPSTLQQRLTYSYDGVGNVLSIQNDLNGETQSEQFNYDYLDRLLTAGAADGNNGLYSTDYTYDDIGNLTSKGGTSYTYGTQQPYCTAGALDKPHAVTSQGGWQYCYDANGNMTSKAVPSILATNYSYDDENRLTEVAENGSPIAKYTYDGDGNRVKVASTQTTFYVGNHVEWRNGTLTKYYYVGSTRVAMREGDTLSFILANQLGSATVTLDSTGSVQSELRYHPFGETRHSNGTTPTTRRFTGQIQDEGTGLYYYNARYYDPALGRFIQADTIVPEPGNPQALNRYSYVYNNPLKYTDPTGHFTDGEIAAAYGVNDPRDIWWWNDPAYDGWQHMLTQAILADIVVAEVNGATYELMFVTGGDNEIVLWDINNQRTLNPDLIKAPNKWQVFRNEGGDYWHSGWRRYLEGDNGYMLVEPKLAEGWNLNFQTNAWVRLEYQNQPWTKGDVATVTGAVAAGAYGGTTLPVTGPVGPVAGGIGAGLITAGTIEANHWLNADMRPQYYHGGWSRNYNSTYSHYPSAR